MRIAVIGLGYVGLPVSLLFAAKGDHVLGLDIDPTKIDAIHSGRSYFHHIDAKSICCVVESGHFEASTDLSRVREVETIVICVPTPLNKDRSPNLLYVLKTAHDIAPHLQKGSLVVLESTTYPGTTEEELREALERGSGLRAGIDFALGYSPEREDPGNAQSRMATVPKIVAGLTPQCLERMKAFYGRAVEHLVPVSNCRTAEATKLMENIFRAVNIALVNELKVTFMAMGIDIWEAIEAAKTKPFGYMPFYPGPGMGGHCIPIDPFYLTWKAREFGQHTRFIELAGDINTNMPEFVIRQLMEALNEEKKSINGSRILVLGLAYKADIDDDRESPSYALMRLLEWYKAEVAFYDPYITTIRPRRSSTQWTGMKSVEWTQESLSRFDAAIICTAHRVVNYQQLIDWVPCVIDTRNCLSSVTPSNTRIRKA